MGERDFGLIATEKPCCAQRMTSAHLVSKAHQRSTGEFSRLVCCQNLADFGALSGGISRRISDVGVEHMPTGVVALLRLLARCYKR
jgi:hypothetical protein